MRFWVIAGVFAIIGVFLAVQGGVTKDVSRGANNIEETVNAEA